MSNSVLSLFKRDFRKAMNLRTWLIWIGMSAVCFVFLLYFQWQARSCRRGFCGFYVIVSTADYFWSMGSPFLFIMI